MKKKGRIKKKVTKKKIVKKKAKKKVIKRKKKVAKTKKQALSKPSKSIGVSLQEVGIITHYFPRVEAAVVKLTKGSLSLGDSVIIKGHTTDLKEKVNSIQLDHVPITSATKGQEIGIRVKSKVRDHDVLYKVIG